MKIHQQKNIFPDQKIARYNLAAWPNHTTGTDCFIGREVTQAGKSGEPDTGVLKLFELKDGKIVNDRVIWKPDFDGINLEDARVLELPNENLLIGLTAVLRNKKGRPIPFPAIIKIDSHNSWTQELPPYLIITTFGPGKNLTPVDNTTFLFRPDDVGYHHKILVFSLHRQVPEKIDDIEFPRNLGWAKWRIGTTMPPIWLNDKEALFIVHGITKKRIGGKQKYVYSLGRAKLTRHENQFDITLSPDPILTPDSFLDSQGKPLVKELHPHLRRVVYSCGGIIRKHSQDLLSLYVNVGDRTTYEVELSLSELKEGLDFSGE
jgi:predicted GH43/DUF377 family glycosyl hydrolase